MGPAWGILLQESPMPSFIPLTTLPGPAQFVQGLQEALVKE